MEKSGTYWFPLDFKGTDKASLLAMVESAIDQRIALASKDLEVSESTPAKLSFRLSPYLDDPLQLLTITFDVPDNS